jgi:hypothetical protein
MSLILFSTSCYIKGNPYIVQICIDENSPEHSLSTLDNILLTNDNFQLKSDTVNNLTCIRIEFEFLTNEKINSINKNDDTIPRTIILNKLLNVKRIENLSNESSQIHLNFVDISESFIWTVKQIELQTDSIASNQLCLILNENLLKLKNRPRNLLVFVNPKCGKGK